MRLISTRGCEPAVTATHAFIQGIAPDGGLFVPEEYPTVSERFLQRLMPLTYQERAERVLALFLEDEYTREEIAACVDGAYTGKFVRGTVPLREVGGAYVMELFHGPTCAFKDMALQLFPRLLPLALKKEGVSETVLILVATSGDTGKAAMDGFADVAGTQVLVFYPEGGVSRAQRLQMVTQRGENVAAAAVRGNFDDAQTGVKRLFGDPKFIREQRGRGRLLSSANSINFGRLLPQVVYYFSAYADLCVRGVIQIGDPVNFCVPTGNFGNILAGWYAREMGLPIKRLICASNRNNVLADFLATGEYDANRDFFRTSSPSMDILISSNLERLLFDLCGRDASRVRQWMEGLTKTGKYAVGPDEAARMKSVFSGGWADDQAAAEVIGRVFADRQYLMDPHTAVAWKVWEDYTRMARDNTPTVIVSTADPYKFPREVLEAIGETAPEDDFEAAARLEALTNMSMPNSLKELPGLPERHLTVCDIAGMGAAVGDIFG